MAPLCPLKGLCTEVEIARAGRTLLTCSNSSGHCTESTCGCPARCHHTRHVPGLNPDSASITVILQGVYSCGSQRQWPLSLHQSHGSIWTAGMLQAVPNARFNPRSRHCQQLANALPLLCSMSMASLSCKALTVGLVPSDDPVI